MRDYDDLSHVPRRAVGMAKDLRRMGLRVVIVGEEADKGEEMSDKDVKFVTDAAHQITEVGRRAREVALGMRDAISEVNDALGIAQDVQRALRAAASELRGALGVQTNNPPPEEEGPS